MTNRKLYEIALTLIPGLGDVNGKKLVAYCGGAEAVFCEKKKALTKINGVSENVIKSLDSKEVMKKAEKEMQERIEKAKRDRELELYKLGRENYF